MGTLGTVNTRDLEFLLGLNRKLHRTREGTYTPNIRGGPFKILIDTYTDEKLTGKEMQRLFGILKRSDFIFAPANTAMGFSVGFSVINPDTQELLLIFKESQLPQNYDFQRLSEYFMEPANLERAKTLNIEIQNDYKHYEY